MSGATRTPPSSPGSGVQHNGIPVTNPNLIDATTIDLVALGMDYGLRPTPDKTTAYSAGIGDYVVCNTTGGAFAVAAPGGTQQAWARFGVHNRFISGTNAVTVNAGTGDTFDVTAANGGATSKTLVPGQWGVWEYDSSISVWKPVMQGLSKAGMDALYAAVGAGGGTTLPAADGGDPTSTYGAADFIDGGTP